MKLVIEIPDHIYEHAKNRSEDSYDEWDAMRAIAKGFPYEERPHGVWLPCTFTDKRTGETVNFTIGSVIMMTCSACNKDAFAGGNFCPNCGTPMISSNSEIEKSKSEIVPDYRDGWRLKEGDENGTDS